MNRPIPLGQSKADIKIWVEIRLMGKNCWKYSRIAVTVFKSIL